MATFYLRKYLAMMGICILSPFFSLWAQPHYSLQDLVDASAKNLPVLKQKQSLIDAAKALVTDVKHSFLPQVKAGEQLTLGSDNSLAGSYFTFGITPSTSAGVRNSNSLEAASGNLAVVYSEYELANFGLNDAKLKYVNSIVNLQEADWKKEQYFVQMEVGRLYFTILKNQYRLDADKQNVERYQTVFTVIHALTASGLKPGADSSLAKAELSRSRISYNQTYGRIGQLKEQLAFFTGIPSGQLQIDTLANNSLYSQHRLPDFIMDSLNNPLLDYYTKKQQLYLSNDALIKKSYLPKVLLAGATWARGSSIQYSDQYKSLATGLGYQRFNYSLGIAFTYNLFNGLYRKDKLAVNRFQIQAGDFELQQQKAALNSALLQSDNSLRTTQANLLELPVQLRSAQDTYGQKLAQYKAGIISLIDLTNASFVLYRSQTDYIETLNDWYLAQLDKAASTGNLTQFIQTIK
jgi:outer membrane protein TolC